MVRLEVVRSRPLDDPASAPPNREVDGPFGVVEPDGEVFPTFCQEYRRLAGMDSDAFEVA
jgi:hypothetical protein